MRSEIISDKQNRTVIAPRSIVKSKITGVVVLCTEIGLDTFSGVSLEKNGPWEVGEFSNGWNLECFIPFNGKVTLSNE